ncbi:CPBP family intramembrane glutamic endopeptidase [Actinomadura hibisca]|uniref:CPBP family intramembrane glutamic endopeptidase n=1 Tax=Actinomadura hibisca TaxID=68565 RepID=UPI000829A93E|nr:CPBP family intramembrane glutamic endopeptidase [Actinomadura hibisca]
MTTGSSAEPSGGSSTDSCPATRPPRPDASHPDVPALNVRGALTRILAINVLVFTAGDVIGLDMVADLLPPASASAVTLLGTAAWTAGLLARRRMPHRRAAWIAVLTLAAAGCALPIYASLTHTDHIARPVAAVAVTIASTWLCWIVVTATGRPLPGLLPARLTPGSRTWPTPHATPQRTALTVVMVVWISLAAGWASATLSSVLNLPTFAGSQADALGITTHTEYLVRLVRAGLLEELPMVAVVVVLMTAARRSAWQIIALSVALRLAPHMYFGADVITLVPWAVVQAWLYWRTGLLWPIIIGHLIYNVLTLVEFGVLSGRLVGAFLCIGVTAAMMRPDLIPVRPGPHNLVAPPATGHRRRVRAAVRRARDRSTQPSASSTSAASTPSTASMPAASDEPAS